MFGDFETALFWTAPVRAHQSCNSTSFGLFLGFLQGFPEVAVQISQMSHKTLSFGTVSRPCRVAMTQNGPPKLGNIKSTLGFLPMSLGAIRALQVVEVPCFLHSYPEGREPDIETR